LDRGRASIESAQAGVHVEEASAAALQDEVMRKSDLISAGSVGSAEVRRLELQLQGLQARVAQAKSSVIEARAAAAQAEAALETDRIALANAELQLSRTEIRSPCNGTVLARLVEPGSRIAMPRAGEVSGMAGAVVRLYEPSKLQVRVDVPLADAAKVGIGTSAEISTEALPNDTFSGTVSRIVHEANIQRNTVQYKVAITDPSPLLKPEMLCRVKLHSKLNNTASGGDAGAMDGWDSTGLRLVVPSDVLINQQESKAQVWIVDSQLNKSSAAAVLREVALGGQDGNDTVILSGIKPGDRVIVNPPDNLKNGTRVRIVGEVASAQSE
jgi:HlyD family secretion protein